MERQSTSKDSKRRCSEDFPSSYKNPLLEEMERRSISERRGVEDIPSSSKKPRLRDDDRESGHHWNRSIRKRIEDTREIPRGDQSWGFTKRKINRPSLLKQLQSILARYPNDSQILHEMVQNAEDAGATCMKILYDNHHIDPGGIIGNYFKSPGICLYNDAQFTKDDWQGIISIYSSVKENNTLQVGRFGLGFKSVFHLTDNPVIISGDTLLIIDPITSEKDGDECCLSITLKEFKKHHDTDKLMRKTFLANRFNFKDVLEKGQYDGTLFWLPLRQHPSKLCTTVYADNKANSLLSSFSKEASSILLFLRSMEKIQIFTSEDNMPNFTVLVQDKDINKGFKARKKYNDTLKGMGNALPPSSIIGKYNVLIETTNTKHSFAIVHCLTGMDALPDEMKSLAAELNQSPFTGIAFCTDSFGHIKPQGHVFSFLPLPQQEKSMTGLPVHVNGFFELEDNRRYIKFAASNIESEQKDKALLWNDCMIKHLIPDTYILLIQLLRKKCKNEMNSKMVVSDYYQSIPNPKRIESNWQPLLKPLYEKLLGEASFYTEQGDGKWITYPESFFSIFQEDCLDSKHIQSTINKFLLDSGKNLVEIPSHIVTVLEYMDTTPDPISPKVVRSLLKKAELWLHYSDKMKLELLSFVLKDEQYTDLEGIQLLPLNHNTFTPFSNNIKERSVFVMEEDSNKLFPGLAKQFLSKGRVRDHGHIWESLFDMATKENKGMFQLKVLGNDDLPGVLTQTLDINCVKKDVRCIPKPSSGLGKEWIIDIWKEIRCRRYLSLDQFNSVSLIPLQINPVMKYGQNSQERKTELELLPLKGNYMLKAVTTSNKSMEAMEKIVQLLGTRIISQHQLILPADIFEHYIYKQSDETIRECLQKASRSTNLQEVAFKINDKCNENERCYLNDFLERWPLPIPNVAHPLLKMLRIFRESDNVNPLKMVSFNENCIAIANNNFEFPKGVLFPGKFLLSKHSRLVKELGGMELEENECISRTLDLMVKEKSQYSIDDRVKVMVHLQDRPKVLKHVLQKAKDLVFMKSTNGKRFRVRDLFNNSSELLQTLFYGDKDIFPDENFLKQNSFNMEFMRNLGLKSKDHISDEDLMRVAKCIDENMLPPDKLVLKSRALQQCLITKHPTPNVLEKLKDLKWVICSLKVQGYPVNLKWFNDSPMKLYSPKTVKDLNFSALIGSVVPLVDVETSFRNIANNYFWSVSPNPEDIVKHFENVAKSYTCKEHSAYMLMCKEIWTYIGDTIRSKKDVGTFILDKLKRLKCVPTIGYGLHYVQSVVFEFGSHIHFKMDPYVYELANEVKDHNEIFMVMGMRKNVDLELMKLLLELVCKKYTENRDFDANEVKHDRTLAINLLTSIVEMRIDRSLMKTLLIPIKSGNDNVGLQFKTAEECTYTTVKGSSIFNNALIKGINTDDSELANKMHFVHPDLNHLAPHLGIVSVRKRFIFKENASVLPWGQNQSLTARISELLDEYEDGFVVLKELVQNADDAGARKVYVLYDERQNNDCKDGLLLDDGMAECHGQSIWVYNDAIFKEKDFCNLIKLGGETKLKDAATIGKFGLGFCSVYNLTDVPSLISGKSFVVLDPHVYHLGDAAIDNNPGIRLTLTNNVLQVMPNQFKPYNNVFGCSLTQCAKTGYNGTLFRFPLRTHQQAEKSKIKSLPYTKKEVKELLQKFVDDAANLLLFTQNVSEIAVYHLAEQGNPDKEKTLLFKTRKSGKGGSSQIGFLLEVANAMTKDIIKQIKPMLQVVDIGIEVNKSAKRLLPDISPSDTNSNCSWIISWGTGNDSYDQAKKLAKYGAVPVGAVAVPVKKTKCEFIQFLQLKELPKGFYTDGHIFCFLPLALQTILPLHINGCFLVDKARKSIQRFNTDNFVNEKSNWNKTMMSDIINSAYINLLSCVAIRTKNNDAIIKTNYWTLWPKSSMNHSQDVRSLVQAFYQSILCTDARVFYRTGFVCALSDAIFLSPEFRQSNETGQIAYDFLQAAHEGDSVFMDLPFDIYLSFQEFGGENIEKLNNRIISKFNFFKNYFFPMINGKYWRQPSMMLKRNKLIMEALNDVEMHNLVKNFNCIPVECVDILRKPADLVLKTGSISDMFNVNDGRFITPEFLCYTETLCKLEMMIDKIPSTLLIERARSVQSLSRNKKQSILRASAVLKYLNYSIQNHIDVLDELKSIKFLPFMVKPSDWPLLWKGNMTVCEIFLSPSSLFSPLDKATVGSVGYILDTMGNTCSEEFFRTIGIRNVQIEDVVKQMKVLINANLISSEGIVNLCKRWYGFLDKALEPTEQFTFLKKCWNKRIISVKAKMIEPSKVAFSVIGDCRPFLYKMPKKLAKYKRLWSFIGVEDKFDRKTLLGVLYDLSRYTKHMSQKETSSIVDILKNLSNRLKSDGVNLSTLERSNLYIPDIDCKMRHIDHVCYEDGQFEYDDDVYIIHGEITEQVKRDLGIMSKRQLFLIRYGCPLPFGQNEPLVTRLKGIISAYPRDHSILNELLQNADDAGASEVHFVYDLRQHRTEYILDDRCKVLQGPALCVFNDSCFSDADIKGIQNLGKGSKMNDRTKTGQFGVGFNAVYHLSDAPSFLTKGPTTPDMGAVCIFDPHCWYLPRFATPTNPGMMLTLDKFRSKYRDSYGGYLQDILPADVGTWFRLPLRTENEDFKSEISNHCIIETDMKDLFRKMKQQINNSLLFLSCVQKISMSYIKPNDTKLSQTFSVNLSMSDFDKHNLKTFAFHARKEFEFLKNKRKQINEMAFKEITYTAELKDNLGNVDIWLLCQTFGFKDTNMIPEVVVQASFNGELGFLPRGGTAFKFNVEPTHGRRREDGTAFCSLPLPIFTGLPCHINGHFSIHSDRSQIFCGKNKDDERYIWNKLLFKEVVAHSYASCMVYTKNTLPLLMVENSTIEYLNVFFECFPVFTEVSSDFLKDFVFEIFRNIAARELEIFPVFPAYTSYIQEMLTHGVVVAFAKQIRWVPLKCQGDSFTALFDDLCSYYKHSEEKPKLDVVSCSRIENTRETVLLDVHIVRNVFVDLGMKLICTPLWIYNSMVDACQLHHNQNENNDHKEHTSEDCIPLAKCSPNVAVLFLKSWTTNSIDKCKIEVNMPLHESIFKTVDRVCCTLTFCLKQTNVKPYELSDLPLLVSNAGYLFSISNMNKLIMSKFSSLFPESGEEFVHKSLIRPLKRFKPLFLTLSMVRFLSFLGKAVDPYTYKKEGPVKLDEEVKSPSPKWISKVWKYLDENESIIELNDWCLFPSVWYKGELVLVSIKQAFTVVDHKSFSSGNTSDRCLGNIFEKLELPDISEYNQSSCHLHNLVASRETPDKLAKCLIYHKDHIQHHNLSIEECDTILEFFDKNIGSVDWHEMKCLRLYTTIDNRIVDINEFDKILVLNTENETFVLQGLNKLAEKLNTVLLRHNSYHTKMYKALNMSLCIKQDDEPPLMEFYVSFVLPHYEFLPENTRIFHLKYVKEKLLKFKSQKLETSLKNLHFLSKLKEKALCKACDFFSPHNTIFIEFCSESELPQSPFNQLEWKEFINVAGIKTEVGHKQFIVFARHIELQGLNEKSEAQSKELIKHLLTMSIHDLDTAFLDEIRKIKFIVPFVVDRNYALIFPQKTTNALLAFSGSVHEKDFRIAWTTHDIISDYDIPPDWKEVLDIKDNPTMESVIMHLCNVCDSLQGGMLKEESIFVTDLMTQIYRYLLPISNCQTLCEKLQEIPVVHVMESNLFLPAKNVFLKEQKISEIKPYLMLGSEKYGDFFDLFRRIGASDQITLDQYIRVLASIKKTVGSSQLAIEERECTEKAVRGLLKLLQFHSNSVVETVTETVCYLLDEAGRLFPSNHLVFADNNALKRRLKDQTKIKFLFSTDQFKSDGIDVDKCFSMLPDNMRPRKLSKMVEEELISSHRMLWKVADILESFVSSDVFVHCIIRLVKSASDTEILSLEMSNDITFNLKSIKVIAVETLQTILKIDNVQIESSRKNKPVFHLKSTNTVYIAYEDYDDLKWIAKFHHHVAYVIHKLCFKKPEIKHIQTILSNYNSTADELFTILDDLGIVPVDYMPTDKFWTPSLGTRVPKDCLKFLVHDLIQFLPGDRAVLEVFDYLFDDDRDKGSSTGQLIYVYVRVIKCLSDNQEQFPFYLIDTGEGRTREVRSTELYKIVRCDQQVEVEHELHVELYSGTKEKCTEQNDKEKIFQEIEEALIDAWKLGQKDFKRVFRRLLLCWHPDKNKNSELYNEVTKHIITIVKRLENGEIDTEKVPPYNQRYQNRRSSHFTDYRRQWNDNIGRTTKAQGDRTGHTFDAEDFAERVSRQKRSWNDTAYSDDECRSDPQPDMAKVWLRQAKSDLQAAESLLRVATAETFNWVCVTSHQAAEKALKAVQVAKDGVESRSHCLITTAVLGDATLKHAAEELEARVGDYTKMRYPRPVFYPNAPCDLYDRTDAEETIRLAKIIVETVGNMIK